MATDLAEIVSRLTSFYVFTDLTVVAVGAGGGQLAEWARRAAHVVAVDPDGAAIDRLVRRTLDVSATQRFADMPYRLALL